MPVRWLGKPIESLETRARQTFVSNVHFRFELFELVGVSGLCLGAHLLASPLHGAVDFARKVHGCCRVGFDNLIVPDASKK